MANCSHINNTTIKGTSTITYDGTPLPCTDINTCDNLNVILAKLDAIACSATESVNTLTEEVMNITEDVMMITEDLININDQLNICCPSCDFTGTVDQIPDPITTTTTSSSTSTSTTTSTSTSTTTSTSTSTSTTTSTSSTTTTTTTAAAPFIYPSSAEYQCSETTGCGVDGYPFTVLNIPAPQNLATMFHPVISWSEIEYVEILTVTSIPGFEVKYNGLTVAPGLILYPVGALNWVYGMSVTRDVFDCTNTFEQWTVRIKLYSSSSLSNIETFSVGMVQTYCSECTTTTTTTIL
jgi:hypothetical protein